MDARDKKEISPFIVLRLSNGVIVPTERMIFAIHDRIIEYRKKFGRNDPTNARDPGLVRHVCDMLMDRMHKYTDNPFENAFYVASETFYAIACQHPFMEANKSTAYVAALILLYANLATVAGKKKIMIDQQIFNLGISDAPKEAERISQLAEAGQDEDEVKRLIKEFLARYIKG